MAFYAALEIPAQSSSVRPLRRRRISVKLRNDEMGSGLLGSVMKFVMKTLWAAMFLVSGFALTGVAGPLEDADAAFERGDHEVALQSYRLLADQGEALAQIRLGGIYADGRGVTRDYSEAVKWFRRAANQGNARAQFNIGTMYEHGQGVPQDYAEALKWHHLAAAQGHAGVHGVRAPSLVPLHVRGFQADRDGADAQIELADRAPVLVGLQHGIAEVGVAAPAGRRLGLFRDL